MRGSKGIGPPGAWHGRIRRNWHVTPTDYIGAIGLQIVEALAAAVGPGDLEGVGLGDCAEAEAERELDLGEVAAGGLEVAVADGSSGRELDTGPRGAGVGARTCQDDAEPAMAGGPVVAQEEWRASELDEDEVQVAVTLDVAVGGASPDKGPDQLGELLPRYLDEAGGGSSAGPGRLPRVPEELRWLSVALGWVDLVDVRLHVPVELEEVEAAVEVVVEE
jgi:hypothetical protein